MVLSGSATHSSNCTRLGCSKYPQSTRKIFLGKMKCVAQTQTTIVRKPLPCPKPRLLLPGFLSPARCLNLSIKISQTQGFPPAYQRRHQRNRLSLVFFGIKKNIVVQACCGHFPLCSTFSKNSTIAPHIFFCQVQMDIRDNLLLFLPCTISTLCPIRNLLVLAGIPPTFATPHFPRLVLHVLHAFVTLPMRCPCFPRASQPGILFFFLQDLCSSSPCCGLREFVQTLLSALLII